MHRGRCHGRSGRPGDDTEAGPNPSLHSGSLSDFCTSTDPPLCNRYRALRARLCAGTVWQALGLSRQAGLAHTGGSIQEPVMLKFSGPLVLQLQGGELLPLSGVRLSVERGCVWVTRAGDLDDHVLAAGQAMLLERGAQAIVGAEAPAQLRLAPQRGAWWTALPAWLRRPPVPPRWRPPIAWEAEGGFSLAR